MKKSSSTPFMAAPDYAKSLSAFTVNLLLPTTPTPSMRCWSINQRVAGSIPGRPTRLHQVRTGYLRFSTGFLPENDYR